MSAKNNATTPTPGSTVAKSDDGSIQINFTIPYSLVAEKRNTALKEIGETLEIPGFRKGKAPIDKVESSINHNTLLEKTLQKILPSLLADTILKHNLKLAIYPKFSLLKADKDEDWQVRADTCEIPTVTLGNYKNEVSGSLRSKSLWTPGKDPKEQKTLSKEEKDQIVIKSLVENIKVNIPKILMEEEVNGRLSRMLERIEKLGLSLEAYLASIGKKAEDIRSDYEKQAKEAISLELILNQIALEENIKVDEKEINELIKVSSADKELSEELDTPEKKRVVEAILKRRHALDMLTSLA